MLLYDALDFSTDHNDDGGQTRESLSRITSTSAAAATLLACPGVLAWRPNCLQNSRALKQSDQGSMVAIYC